MLMEDICCADDEKFLLSLAQYDVSSFYVIACHFIHFTSAICTYFPFLFGINWDVEGRTVENCPHICLHVCYTVWFSYSGSLIRTTRVLVRHLSFVAHVRQKHDISRGKKEPKELASSLCSRIPFRTGAPVPQLPLQILFEVHQVAILACCHQMWMHEALIKRAAAAS